MTQLKLTVLATQSEAKTRRMLETISADEEEELNSISGSANCFLLCRILNNILLYIFSLISLVLLDLWLSSEDKMLLIYWRCTG